MDRRRGAFNLIEGEQSNVSVRVLRRGTMAGRGAAAPTTTTVYGQTADGFVRSLSSSYAAVRSGAGLSATPDNESGVVGQYYDGSIYIAWETMLSFDTTAISGTVTAATLSLWGSADSSVTDFGLEVRVKDWSTTVDTSDWVAGSSLGALTLVSTFPSTSSWVTGAYNQFTSGAGFPAAINKGGITRLLVCSAKLTAGTAPTTDESVQFYLGTRAGTANDPKLVIVTS